MIVLYGIKNCDTCRKAARWLDENAVTYRFHDYRQDGLTPGLLEAFADQLGWETLLNRSSASWRALSPEQKTVTERGQAMALMLAIPTLIKRPLLDTGSKLVLGFKAGSYADEL
jgi:arsenate reductase